MRRIVLDLQGGLLAEAVMQVLAGYDPDFIVYRSSKPEDTLALLQKADEALADNRRWLCEEKERVLAAYRRTERGI